MAVGVLGAALLLGGALVVFSWANQEVAHRQIDYNRDRAAAASDGVGMPVTSSGTPYWSGTAASLDMFGTGGGVDRNRETADAVQFPQYVPPAPSDCADPSKVQTVDQLLPCMREPGGGDASGGDSVSGDGDGDGSGDGDGGGGP